MLRLFLLVLILVLLRGLFHSGGGRHNFEERRNVRTVIVRDLDVGLVAQTLEVIFARFWRTFLCHCAAHVVFIEHSGIAAGRAIVYAKNLVTFVTLQGVTYAAGF